MSRMAGECLWDVRSKRLLCPKYCNYLEFLVNSEGLPGPNQYYTLNVVNIINNRRLISKWHFCITINYMVQYTCMSQQIVNVVNGQWILKRIRQNTTYGSPRKCSTHNECGFNTEFPAEIPLSPVTLAVLQNFLPNANGTPPKTIMCLVTKKYHRQKSTISCNQCNWKTSRSPSWKQYPVDRDTRMSDTQNKLKWSFSAPPRCRLK